MMRQRLALLVVASACLCAVVVATNKERGVEDLLQYIRRSDNILSDRIVLTEELLKKGRNATLTYVPKGYPDEGRYPFYLRDSEGQHRGWSEKRHKSEDEGDLPRQHYDHEQPPEYGDIEGGAFEHGWAQWAQSAVHHSYLPVKGQRLAREFLRFTYDPLVEDEASTLGILPVHYPTPLTKKGSKNVFMMVKDPKSMYDPFDYSTQTWGITAFAPNCESGTYDRLWTTWVDWTAPGNLWSFWEPVFHGAFAGDFLYVPAAKGGVHKIDPDTGKILHTYNPFPNFPATERYFTTSPLTVDKQGQIYYTVVAFTDPTWPFDADILGSWLVVIPTQPGAYGAEAEVRVADITTMAALPANGQCDISFSDSQVPWPPTADALTRTADCWKLRAGLNAAPAVADDGTIVIALRTHRSSRTAFVVTLHPDLTVKSATSLRERFADGCGVPIAQGGALPPNGEPGGCREGTRRGVDPATNTLGSGRVIDDSTSSPVIGPDGFIFYGAYTRYNYGQGHLMKFSPKGDYLTAYPFGWDTTPGVYSREAPYGYGEDRNGQSHYSLITKENHYGDVGSYCNDGEYCPAERPSESPEAYWITQLSPDLKVEWQWLSTNTESCERNPNNTVTCVSDHPNGFEWCVNAPALDKDGTVYVNSEDGWLYKIAQGGRLVDKVFQQRAQYAAYTPASLDPEGLILTQNQGTLFIIGETLCGGGDKHY